MLMLGLAVGVLVCVLMVAFRCTFRVEEGHLAVALVGVRVVPARLRTIWPMVAGFIAFGIVTVWKTVA